MTPKERIHVHTFAVTLLFILGATGIFIFNGTITATGYATYDSLSSTCKEYFGDQICDDSLADCGSYYKSGTSLDACDECQTYKNGKPGFDKCPGYTKAEEETKCTDSDGGKNYYVKGLTYGKYQQDNVTEIKSWEDYCGSGGNLIEFSCRSLTFSDSNPIDIFSDYYLCPNGCEDGACLTNKSITPPTTKPSECEGYFGDKICDDSPADCGSSYKSGTSLDACDECQTYKNGKPGFDNCVGTGNNVLLEGETQVYPLAGKDYEVTLDFVSSTVAKFSVSGMSTPQLQVGESYTLVNGVTISVDSIYYEGDVGGKRSAAFSLTIISVPGQVTKPGLEGDVKDSLNKGETKIYTINDKDYEVTLNDVSSTAAKFSVNGESTSSISIGKPFKLADGTEIAVNDILYQDFAGGIKKVEFALKTLPTSKETPTTTSSTPLQKNTCKDSCGTKSKTGDCFCDVASVTKYNDYCADIATYCPEIWKLKTAPTSTLINTCKDSCGTKSKTGDCFCDTACVKYGDCCSDIATYCPSIVSTEPPVILYNSNGYQGKIKSFSSDNPALSDVNFNDEAKSVKVKPGYLTTLYEHSNYDGQCRTLFSDVSSLYSIGFFNGLPPVFGASSLKVWNNFEGVVLYEKDNYALDGRSEYYTAGNYQAFDSDKCMHDDEVSSIKVAPGYTVVLYNYEDYFGDYKVIKEDIQKLKDIGFNDKTSSIKVCKGDSC